jgi:Family of unknown function (DUF6624)
MDDGLRAELLRRMEKDQVARKAPDLDAVLAADAENLPWLKGVLAEHGWPGKSLVGKDGAHAAWLLAQHADADPAFQRRCLDLLAIAAQAGEATAVELAYLTDRVLLHEGQPQVYGTQMIREGKRYVPQRMRDPESVDERRAAVGLGPIAEYVRLFDDDNRAPFQPQLKCPGCGTWVPFDEPEEGQPVAFTCPGCGHEATLRAKQ